MTTKNLEYKILGGVLVISGISLIHNPRWYSSKYSMVLDFTEIKWPLGLMMSFIGFWTIINSFTSKFDNFICPQCENIYKKDIKNPGSCQSCGKELKKLEGYFNIEDNVSENSE